MTAPPAPATPTAQRIATYGLCRDDAGRVLLARAAPYLTVAGQWFLPGGGVDHGEHPVDALRREVQEETGLEVQVGPLLGVLSDLTTLPTGVSLHTVRLIYAIDRWEGAPRDEIGGSTDTARWATVDELPSMPLLPYVSEVLLRYA